MSMFWKISLVWIFGGLGATCRFLITHLLDRCGYASGKLMGLPTLVINVPACFLIGIFAGILASCSWTNTQRLTFVLISMTGFCGGFSTFSSFTLDSLNYFEEGKFRIWLVFGALTVFLGLFGCACGYWLGRRLYPNA